MSSEPGPDQATSVSASSAVSAIRQIREGVLALVERQGAGGAALGVACSGGADSLVLADAMAAVLGEARVVVLHVDHGLVDGSAEVAARVVRWAAARGMRSAVRRVAVARRASLEAAARDARYQALGELVKELGLAAVATAHTARDQAETVLLRILRGTGVAGLAAIGERRIGAGGEVRVLRPLLGVSRSAVEEYARARQLPVWDDPMNKDVRFARVRARQELMPRLAEENPAIEAALLRLAASAAEWAEAIDAMAAPLAGGAGGEGAGERGGMSASRLAAAPAAVRKRAYAMALARRGVSFEAVHLEAIDRLVVGPARGTVATSLPGARVERRYDAVVIERTEAESEAESEPESEAEAESEAESESEPEAESESESEPDAESETEPDTDAESESESEGELIPDEVSDPERFAVRRWRPGDRMRPARLGGRSRKLSDLFVDAKVPRALRATARVVCRKSDGVIVWVDHLGGACDTAPSPPGQEPGKPR